MKQGADALKRLQALIEAARWIANPTHPLGQRARMQLPASSGLSPEGVNWVLNEHLECDPSPEQLEQLLGQATTAPRCHLSLAANVCTAGLRALACALATSPEVSVRPSRRDPVFTTLLIEALETQGRLRAAGGTITLVEQLTPRAGDEVHLYGHDETIAIIRLQLPEGVRLRSYGSGAGVAVVAEGIPLSQAAESLARDLLAFDGRGCLSPRWTLVAGDADRAYAFAEHLHQALDAWHARVPRGPLDADDQAALRRHRHTFEAVGNYFEGESHALALDPEPVALALAPALRCTHVVPCISETLDALIAPWLPYLTVIGAAPNCKLAEQLSAGAPKARRSALGEMQHPPLDGPVDQRSVTPPHG